MDESFNLTWDDGPNVAHREEVICGIDENNLPSNNTEYVEMCEDVVVQEIANETVITDDQQGEEVVFMQENYQSDNVVYMPQDNVLVVQQNEEVPLSDQQYMECQVAEEVITDEWVQGEGRVEVIGDISAQGSGGDDIDIPLSVDQDEYTASRPHPCDFCSRRFRKKANLMNHMVAHQTDRPHGCNLCGARYIRKCDLMNHLKIHAYAPEPEGYEENEDDYQVESDYEKPHKKKSNSKKRKSMKTKIKQETEEEKYSRSYDYVDEDMRLLTEMANNSSRTFEYDTANYSEAIPPENHPISEPRYPITDPRKPFVCQHCGVGFAREKALASHARIHLGDSPFECETCGDMFWDITLLKEHVRNKHGDTGAVSYDDDDDEDYVEDEEKYGEFYCQTCGMSFHRQDLLRRHSRIHVKEEYVNEAEFGHVCNVCGDSFPEALDLLAHAEVHARLDVHRCMLCGESFSEEQAMATHIAQRHAKNMPPNSCMLCGKACKDRRTLLKHSWEHSREKAFSCSKCGKCFYNKARLKRHMSSHRNKVVSCEVCGQDFPDGRSLMNHRHSHSNMAGRQFPCRECGKTFGSRSSQQIHIRIHTGERPYGCRFCWKAFADGGTLRKHERIHTGEKPYACAVCPRAFNQRVVLREHIRSHHSGPDPKYGTSLTPYCCNVCSNLFSTSQDLIVHLIQHCDFNTAMKRQPQMGPRKYKRRRKLKPHELERLSNRMDREETETAVANLSDSDNEVRRKIVKRNRKPKVPLEEDYESMCQSVESAVQTINSIVNSKPSNRGRKKKIVATVNDSQAPVPSRPKMIYTQKTRVAVEVNTPEGSKIRHKTKTLVTRSTPSAASSNSNASEVPKNGERNRPRTKNVSYHVYQPEKYPVATFNSTDDRIKSEPKSSNDVTVKTELRDSVDEVTSEMFNNVPIEDNPTNSALGLENDLHDHVAQNIEISASDSVPEAANEVCIGEEVMSEVNGNSEIKNNTRVYKPVTNTRKSPGRPRAKSVRPVAVNIIKVVKKSTRKINKEQGKNQFMEILNNSMESNEMVLPDMQEPVVNVKLEPMETTSLHELAELSMQHAQSQFKCEMCSESFSDREQLLLHVPIHI